MDGGDAEPARPNTTRLNGVRRMIEFQNPVFHKGINLTIRRGVKWSLQDTGLNVESVYIKRFCDITGRELSFEHDPNCQNYEGSLCEMRRIYDDFDPCEIVTLVFFHHA